MKALWVVVAAAAIVTIPACTALQDRENAALDRIEQEHQARVASLQRDYERAQSQQKKDAACIASFPLLKIGDDFRSVQRAMPCKPDKVNSTETGRTYSEQWVFEFEGVPGLMSDSYAYLYFDNGRLVGKQM
jgi:hypothetical protein